jgi:mono/diheme cytochrome c family protein
MQHPPCGRWRIQRVLLFLAALAVGGSLFGRASAEEPDLFRSVVAPAFERNCVRCHQSPEPKGGFLLTTATALKAGGESGAAIAVGEPDKSLLVEMIAGAKPEMPKNAPPLSPGEVEAIRAWVAAGAVWPEGVTLTEKKTINTDWWSLRPINNSTPPAIDSTWVRTPVDAFVLAKLQEQHLMPAAEADRRTLARRVYFDLTGLPPTADEVDAFAADPDPAAYEKLVDRLLDSPRYGERWARHWLDVVHYADTHGYDKDQLRPNAWPYRDYVIRSFNADKNYTRFVQEQLAGDVLFPDTVDGLEALGFIAAGPWDLIGHAEVPESKIDGKIARHLDRDDMVATSINTFVSLTAQCAQCHNHKFDPISQEDYYCLQANFAALDRAERTYDADPAVGRRRNELVADQRRLTERQKTIGLAVKEQAGPEVVELDKQIAAINAVKTGEVVLQNVRFGYHSAIERSADVVKWVQVDLGASKSIDHLVFTPCYDDFNGIGAGFGFPTRFKIEVFSDADLPTAQIVLDQTSEDAPTVGTTPQRCDVGGLVGRYVRFTATQLAPRQHDFIFALAELQVFDGAGVNLALNKPVVSLDSIEAMPRWSMANLVDGIEPPAITSPADRVAKVAALNARRAALIESRVDEATRGEQSSLAKRLSEINAELNKLGPGKRVYSGTIHYAPAQTFSGTGPSGGKPRKICVLPRGDVTKPGKEVGPGAIAAIAPLVGRFELSADHPEGERRAALARWVTDSQNPLTWRSIVNRIWLYHFGRGLVDTPNDFGRMGQQPTHPELLDWLAAEFRDGGQSFKAMHRLLLRSAVYRQASTDNPAAAAVDGGNAYYWRMNRRRLEAEAIRDSILLASGKLNDTMYGPGFQDFVIEQPAHSPHYQYHLHDPENPASHRRSVYRFIVRSQQQPFLTTLDCADPSSLVDKRNQTISPLQSLAMLNNQLCLVMAKHFAERVSASQPDLAAQITAAYRLALQRSPTAEELAELSVYAQQFGLPNACRVILNLNEFVFVD